MLLKDGLTMMHEHVRIDLSRIKNIDDTNLNCKEETIKEFKKLYDHGVRNVVEVTNYGMGRDLKYINDVAEATGINIVTATGCYKDPFLPEWFKEKSVEEIAEMMIDDILNNGADLIGEIGTSNNEWTLSEMKLFKAAVIAQKETDCVIYTHTTLGTLADKQAQFFLENGVNPDKVVLGHVCLSKSLEYIKELIKMGFNVGFDTIGKNNYFPDEKRAEYLVDLEKSGMIDKVVMSMDITRKSNMEYQGGIGYSYLFTNFIPLCKENGLSDDAIDKIMRVNPKRIFGDLDE